MEPSGKGLGRILKTSPDLSTAAVIANARQVESISLSWAAAFRNGTGDVEMEEGLDESKKASCTFLGQKKVLPRGYYKCNPITPQGSDISADKENKPHNILLKGHSALGLRGILVSFSLPYSQCQGAKSWWQHDNKSISPISFLHSSQPNTVADTVQRRN